MTENSPNVMIPTPERPTEALVTGATGGIGRVLLPELLERGYRVTVLSRREGPGWLHQLDVKVIRGDITLPDTLPAVTENVDVVIHLAGLLRGHLADLYRVNVEGTANLVEACEGRSIRRFIYPSSLLVQQLHGPGRVSEDAPCNPNTHYGKSKLAAEQTLLSAWERSGLPVVILRCGTVITNTSRLRWLVPWLKWRLPLISIPNLVHLVHINDVVQAILLSLNPDIPGGHVFNIADEKPIRGNEVMQSLARAAMAPPPWHFPIGAVKGLVALSERLARLIGARPALTSDMLAVALTNHAGSIEKAKSVLGFEPRHPFVVRELTDLL